MTASVKIVSRWGWVCEDCGDKHGRKPQEPYIGTFHFGICEWCEKHDVPVTSSADYRLYKKEHLGTGSALTSGRG